MKRGKTTKNVQVNIAIPESWKTELDNLARIMSVEEGKVITFQEMMRIALREKFQLGDEDD